MLNQIHKKKPSNLKKRNLLTEFSKTKYFQKTKIDWLEAGL